ncbi:MAG TPA: hypothetical protein VGM80_01475 [Gaiellaceae bacterium]
MRIRSMMVSTAAAAAAATLASSGYAASGACSSGTVLKSRSYVFALSISGVETMYTPAQVKAKHPKSGEVMLSGTMSGGGMSGMDMSSAGQRHLEVHICTAAGAVLTGRHPAIVVSDPKAKTKTMKVPIATMEGVGEGASDYHYGNNVTLATGHKITVTVTLNGQKVVFHAVVRPVSM